MNPDRTLNEGVMNEQSSLELLWEVPYNEYGVPSFCVIWKKCQTKCLHYCITSGIHGISCV